MIHTKNMLITNTIILITLLTTSSMLHAKVGCLSDSYAANKFDNTEHFVACECPCTHTLAKQDRCVRCNHSHVPQSWIIVPEVATSDMKKTTASQKQHKSSTIHAHKKSPSYQTDFYTQPYIIMNNLITQYKNKKQANHTLVQE